MRAKKGGEFNKINNEFYKGGQFMATTDHQKGIYKDIKKENKVRKIEIEPYKWEIAEENFNSIYETLKYSSEIYDKRNNSFSFNQNIKPEFAKPYETRMIFINAYNSGKRYFRYNEGNIEIK